MDVSIIGASGGVGSQTLIQLVAERVLTPESRVQLVGRPDGQSSAKLFGLRNDLLDAYDEFAPRLDLVFSPEEVSGDIVILAAGTSLSKPDQTRNDVARANIDAFRLYAEAIAAHGRGGELVLVISNPVELAVEIFSQYIDRHRVIGLGAYSDSLRFRRELAQELGLGRQSVEAFVAGEHGDNMVPLWSSVHVFGGDEGHASQLAQMRGDRTAADFPAEVARHHAVVTEHLRNARYREAFELVEQLPPDLRVPLRPYITTLSGAKTSIATSNVLVDLVRSLVDGREVVICGQVRLDGEMLDLRVPVGMPVVVDLRGWTQILSLGLADDETRQLVSAAAALDARLREWLAPSAQGAQGAPQPATVNAQPHASEMAS